MANTPSSIVLVLQRFVGRLKSSQLLLLVGSLFVLDLMIPDPFPFIDEIILGVLTVLIARWQSRRSEADEDFGDRSYDSTSYDDKPPTKNVTPDN